MCRKSRIKRQFLLLCDICLVNLTNCKKKVLVEGRLEKIPWLDFIIVLFTSSHKRITIIGAATTISMYFKIITWETVVSDVDAMVCLCCLLPRNYKKHQEYTAGVCLNLPNHFQFMYRK